MMLAPVGRTGPLSCPANRDGFTPVPSDRDEESLKARGDGSAVDVVKSTQQEGLPNGWALRLRQLRETGGETSAEAG
jgi:hypothetical protein